MENSKTLASRFREVLLDGKWIANTNVKQQIMDVSFEEANQRIGSLNTIALLTFHLDYYIGGVLNVLEGGPLEIRDRFSFDMPELKSASDWGRLRGQIIEHSELFAQHIEKMSDEQLEQYFVKKDYGNYRRNIEGIIEHSYYHLGQISLIKKLIRTVKTS